jgi:hypothetical protein
MRILGIVALSAALMGCAAGRQEVAARLGAEYIGQNADSLVMRFGPPTSSFKMSSGGNSYVWQLTSVTDVSTDRGSGTISTRSCKVSVITSPAGIVTDLQTEDSAGDGYIVSVGSMCGQRLGMKRANIANAAQRIRLGNAVLELQIVTCGYAGVPLAYSKSDA